MMMLNSTMGKGESKKISWVKMRELRELMGERI
jgi:hypothetical protein